ncbi:hypothetical protein FSP39_005030, partial [Pinctada imbricata]
VFEPKAIRDQMVFENFIMLKMFLSASALGQFVFCLLSVVPQTRSKFENAERAFVQCMSEKSILTSAVGAFALGSGMTLSGACPGMVLAQVGAWVPNGIFTLLGAILGTLTYGMLASYIVKFTRPKKPFTNHLVHDKLGVRYFYLAIPMAIFLTIIVIIIEIFWHWTKDIKNLHRDNSSDDNVATAVSWPPYACGMIIGLLQLPLVLVLCDTVGGSSGYVTVVSQWVVTDKLKEKFPYLAKRRLGVSNWWQVFYVCGAIIGALISAASSNSIAIAKGPQVHVALFGGFLMLFGARFAAGCTSGHGLSGMGLLAWLSFLAVPAMFAGGIVTAFSMQATGSLDTYVTTTGYI